MTKRWFALFGVLTVLTAAEAQAQVAGTYTWEFPARVRRDDGGETVEQKGLAKLTITVKGDSILGSLASSVPGMPAQPDRPVRGTVKGNAIEFRLNSQARMVTNGEERTVDTVQIYNATITGDAIKVTMTPQVTDGSVSLPARSFEGKRTT
ncbi:MAG: hypothetical protein ACREMA_16110 [Longimicrobiales bacterium]